MSKISKLLEEFERITENEIHNEDTHNKVFKYLEQELDGKKINSTTVEVNNDHSFEDNYIDIEFSVDYSDHILEKIENLLKTYPISKNEYEISCDCQVVEGSIKGIDVRATVKIKNDNILNKLKEVKNHILNFVSEVCDLA